MFSDRELNVIFMLMFGIVAALYTTIGFFAGLLIWG